MPSLVIRLEPEKLANPDLDLRYAIPARLVELTGGGLQDEGYGYADDTRSDSAMFLFFSTAELDTTLPVVIDFVETERVLHNDLSLAATIGTSLSELYEATDLHIAYPRDAKGAMHLPPR